MIVWEWPETPDTPSPISQVRWSQTYVTSSFYCSILKYTDHDAFIQQGSKSHHYLLLRCMCVHKDMHFHFKNIVGLRFLSVCGTPFYYLDFTVITRISCHHTDVTLGTRLMSYLRLQGCWHYILDPRPVVPPNHKLLLLMNHFPVQSPLHWAPISSNGFCCCCFEGYLGLNIIF